MKQGSGPSENETSINLTPEAEIGARLSNALLAENSIFSAAYCTGLITQIIKELNSGRIKRIKDNEQKKLDTINYTKQDSGSIYVVITFQSGRKITFTLFPLKRGTSHSNLKEDFMARNIDVLTPTELGIRKGTGSKVKSALASDEEDL